MEAATKLVDPSEKDGIKKSKIDFITRVKKNSKPPKRIKKKQQQKQKELKGQSLPKNFTLSSRDPTLSKPLIRTMLSSPFSIKWFVLM